MPDMVSKRMATRLVAWLALVVLASRALAQVPANSGLDYPIPGHGWEDGPAAFAKDMPSKFHGIWPFAPGHVGQDAQPFAPAQTSGFGNGPRPKVGWWGSYERLFWSLSAPDTSFIGAPPLTQSFDFPFFDTPAFGGSGFDDIDNSFVRAIGAWGNRWEIGYMDNTNYGWFVSVLDHVSQGQFQIIQDPLITFGDPDRILEGFSTVPIPNTNPTQFITFDIGQLPGAFETLEMKNQLVLNGVELSRDYRAPRLHNGGYLEVIYGARWFQVDDAFIVKGFGNGDGTFAVTILGTTNTYPLNILDESKWSTRSINNLIGPQIGLRWFRQRDHWITSVEGRFLAAANFQNTSQVTNLGSETIINATSTDSAGADFEFIGLGTRTHQYNTVFSPMGELRVNAAYLVTKSCAIKVGYTGIVAGNVSRASNRVDYNSVNLVGISPDHNREIFFSNGLSFGVEFNR